MNELTYSKLNEVSKMKPSEFAEKYLNIKLLDYQKQLLDKIGDNQFFLKINYPRGYSYEKRLIRYYEACIRLSKMKNNDVIVIVKPSGWEKMNKKQFANYLCNDYWR